MCTLACYADRTNREIEIERGQNLFRTILCNGQDIPGEFWRPYIYKSTKGGFDGREYNIGREWQLVWHDGGNLSLFSVIDSGV